jgi:monothiol glutaredoxin
MKIKAYLKPRCGWSRGVRAVFQKHNVVYDDIDIVNNADSYQEMVRKSGQPFSPCVEIDGIMLGNVSGEEVETYMVSNSLVGAKNEANDVPTDRGCSDEEHNKKRQEQDTRSFAELRDADSIF